MKQIVLILGLGITGKSAFDYLIKKGYNVIGVDKKVTEYKGFKILNESDDIAYDVLDFALKSPGISFDHPIALELNKRGIPIVSDIDLGLKELSEKGKTLIAITGSNGKTTTTLLTTHILNKAGKKAVAVGNVGVPILSQIDCEEDYVVVELSSYQLETLKAPAFSFGAILNITPNHLDRYPSFEAYAAAKFRLGLCLKQEGKLFIDADLQRNFPHLCLPIKEKVATILPLGYRGEVFSDLPHDLQNLAASYRFCTEFGISEEEIWQGAKSFKKPPHRIEFVACIDGVNYINDSKSSSVDAVEKAVESMKGKCILIAGGVDKGGSYAPWKALFRKKLEFLLLIGQAADKIEEELKGECPIEVVGNLKRAVERAKAVAKEGQTVLLSPGCSSFDQFNHFEHRGDVFKELVNAIGEKKL